MRSDVAVGLRVRSLASPLLVLLGALAIMGSVAPTRAAVIPAVSFCDVNADERADSVPVGAFADFVPALQVEEDGAGGQFGTGTTLTITAPNGFEFDPASPVTAAASNDLGLSPATQTATQVSFLVLAQSTTPGTVTFSGLKARPTALAFARRANHPVRLFSTVFGQAWNPIIAFIRVSPGKPYSLALSAGAQPVEVPLNTNVTFAITIRDEAGNTVDTNPVDPDPNPNADPPAVYAALTDLLVVTAYGSADASQLVYSGAGVTMNAPANGQAKIIGQVTNVRDQIEFLCRDNNANEETVSFIVSDGHGVLLPSSPSVPVRWYEESFPGGGDVRVITVGQGLVLGMNQMTTDNRTDGPAPAFAQLVPDPVIREGAVDQIIGNIDITPPPGWEFDIANPVTATVVGSTDLFADQVTPAPDLIRFRVRTPSAPPGSLSQITFSGIALRPTNCAAAALGDHYVRITTGNGFAPGLNGAVLGRIEMFPGVPATFEVVANPALTGVGLPSVITIRGLDGCLNRSALYQTTANITVTPTAGNTDPTTLTYVDLYGGGLTSAGGVATIPAGTFFDAVGEYSLQVSNSAEEIVTFEVDDGAGGVSPVSTDPPIQWVTPTCTFPDGISIWVSADKLNVLVLGTDGADAADTVTLEAVDVSQGQWVPEDTTATPPVPPYPAEDSKFLTINGHHCPDPDADPGNAGIPLVDGLRVTINTLGGPDRIDWSGLTVESTGGVMVAVTANAGEGDDTIAPGPGPCPAPGLTGGPGRDTLDYSLIVPAMGDTGGGTNAAGITFVSPRLVTGFNNRVREVIDTGILTAFEEIRGTENADTIRAAEGVSTTIYGGDGADDLYGGNEADFIYGEAGNDYLVGGAGNDRLDGGADADGFDGGEGDDTINAAEGDDGTIAGRTVDGGPGNDIINGGPGNDIIYGGDGNDTINAAEGDDTVYGDDPRITVEPIPAGMDIINGGPGNDFIDGGPLADQLRGGAGDDTIYGDDGNDFMWGEDGNDFMYGGDGDDVMFGGAGDDYLDGGAGNDAIDGGPGSDTIIGGDGNDHIMCGDGDDGKPDSPINGGPGDDIVEGGGGSDVLTGGPGKNVVIGNAGADTLLVWGGEYDVCDYAHDGGPGGIDLDLGAGTCTDSWGSKDNVDGAFAIYRGTARADRMRASVDRAVIFLGGAGGDTLIGSKQGGDILYGEGDGDTLFGDPPTDEANPTFADKGGADILIGGSGDDTIWGGPGSDEIYGDGDYVPQNFDEDRTTPNYYPDDQMIQLWAPYRGAPWSMAVIDPQPIQAGGALPIVYTTDTILNIRDCLRDYNNQTTVKNAFALPASEFYRGAASLAYPGVPPGNDTIYGGGSGDLLAGGGGNDTIWGGTSKMNKDLPYPGRNDTWNIDVGDLIYGGYVCNRPAALQYFGSWIDLYSPNPITLTFAPPLANGMAAPWEPTPTDELLSDGTRKYPIPRPATMQPYDMEPSRAGGDDEIHGGFGPDVILGEGGNDRINGNRDNDVIYGDYFFHRDRDDTYALCTGFGAAASGMDSIRGNEGTDYLFGGPGSDLLWGGDPAEGEGDSELEKPWAKWPELGDVMQGNTGNDIIVGSDVNGLGNRNIKDDNLDRGVADFGYLCISWNGNPFSCATIDSGVSDTVDYSMVPPTSTGINVDLGNNDPGGYWRVANSDDGEGGIDQIYGVENVVGTRSVDVIKGTTRSDDSQPWSLESRYWNIRVTDAFGRERFPDQLTHSNGPYSRNPLRYKYGYDNILLGEDGNDTLIGRRGADALCGGRGNDKLWGDGQFETTAPPGAIDPDNPATNGNDELWGDEGDDELYGEWGDDIVHGGPGFDFLSGGNGVDVLAYTELDDFRGDSMPGVTVNLRQEPIDLAVWTPYAQAYASYGWPLDPVASLVPPGGFPAMTLTMPDDVNFGKTIQLQFPGGTVLPAWPYTPANMANGRGLAVARAGGFYDVIINRYVEPGTPPIDGSIFNPDRFETVYGTPFSDVIYGHNSAPSTLFGDSAGFWLGGGNDILVGGSGNDTIYGEGGNDVLEGRLGNDTLVGSDPPPTPPGVQMETPRDWVSYKDATAGVVVNLSETEQQDTISDGLDRLVEIQNVLGSTFADRITGNWRVNVLAGGPGDDTLIGRSDHDIEQGNRTYIMSDTLHGGAGYDTANYSYGNPTLVRAAAAQWTNSACSAPNASSACGFMSDDGEAGSDKTVDIEAIRESDDALVISRPTRKVISPGQSVALVFEVQGGDGRYKTTFDPTTTTKQTLAEDGRVLNTKKVAILAAPPDQANPVNPFQLDVDIPDYQAVRFLTGTPAANGRWRFTVYARPTVTTSYRATVTDQNSLNPGSETAGRKQASSLVEVVVTEELKVTVEQPEYIITAGQSVQLRGMVSGGITPYHITWEADNGSQGTTLSATNILIPIANPTVTTKYTLRVQDSTPDSLSQEQTAVTKVTVLPGASGSNIPSGSNTPSGTGGSTNNNTTDTGGNNNAPTEPVTNEVSGTEEASNTPVVPMCGFGVTSWVVVGNLLLLAVMKRRRW